MNRDITRAVHTGVACLLALAVVIVAEFVVRSHTGTLSGWWVLGGVG